MQDLHAIKVASLRRNFLDAIGDKVGDSIRGNAKLELGTPVENDHGIYAGMVANSLEICLLEFDVYLFPSWSPD